MRITNQFTVSAPVDKAWEVLTDLEGLAPCLPGAMLTGKQGDDYLGKVKIKIGPVTSEFNGTARFAELDPTSHRAVIDAKGRDTKGAGNASALVSARLEDHGSSTIVHVDTDMKIAGKLAQFGSGMIQQVSEKLLGEFANRLEAKLTATGATTTDAASAVATTATSPSAPLPSRSRPASSSP